MERERPIDKCSHFGGAGYVSTLVRRYLMACMEPMGNHLPSLSPCCAHFPKPEGAAHDTPAIQVKHNFICYGPYESILMCSRGVARDCRVSQDGCVDQIQMNIFGIKARRQMLNIWQFHRWWEVVTTECDASAMNPRAPNLVSFRRPTTSKQRATPRTV